MESVKTRSDADFLGGLDLEEAGRKLHGFVSELYPICRSISGNGLRETLRRIGRHIPLKTREVPTGTRVFDWEVPREWDVREAWIKDPSGQEVVNFKHSNLHVLGYSVPVHRRISLGELREHVYSLPEHPEWIPYRTSYYRENWGFCIQHRVLEQLPEGEYEVKIDSSLKSGYLSFGECVLPGESQDEVLISTHCCHPSLCNDNLSGVSVATFLARRLMDLTRRYCYRFLFIPTTIGSITWLALNTETLSRIRHGLVLACLGDAGHLTYKKSRRGSAEIDRAAEHVLRQTEKYEIQDFFPYGYDERQFCSPAFNLPVGCLMRTPHGRFPEYHTSMDNLDLVRPESLADSLFRCLSIVQVLEKNRAYRNLKPHCEPQLGRRGLYRATGTAPERRSAEMALLWVLNLSDGGHTLLEVAERSQLPFQTILRAAETLAAHGLLEECSPGKGF